MRVYIKPASVIIKMKKFKYFQSNLMWTLVYSLEPKAYFLPLRFLKNPFVVHLKYIHSSKHVPPKCQMSQV